MNMTLALIWPTFGCAKKTCPATSCQTLVPCLSRKCIAGGLRCTSACRARFLSQVDIYQCMIHNLFDEYRFFPKYPEKELQTTARIFGEIIAHNVLSNIRLGIALRYGPSVCNRKR